MRIRLLIPVVAALLLVGLLVVASPGAMAQEIVFVWTSQFGSPAVDEASAVAADGPGNVYLAGSTEGTLPGQASAGGRDAFVRKHGPDGTALWTNQFGSAATDVGQGVAVDGAGNVYVVGETEGALPGGAALGGSDAFVRKYSPDGGTIVWTRQFGSAAFDEANAATTDGAGNVYVAGSTEGVLAAPAAGSRDAFFRKYSPAGGELLTRQFGTLMVDEAFGVAVDGAGSIYVAGRTNAVLPGGGGSAGGHDAFVRKHDAAGAPLWTRQFGSADFDTGIGVALDGAGNVYVAGSTQGTLPGQSSAGGEDAFVRKYDPDGNVVWSRQFGTPTNDEALGVAVDGGGNVYVAGHTFSTLPGQPSAGAQDAFVRKYDPDGTELWTRQFGSDANDEALGVAVDGAGLVAVTGRTNGTLPGQTSAGAGDAFAAKLTVAAPTPTATATTPPGGPTATPGPGGQPPAVPHDARYFTETGYRIDNDAIFGYFNARGRIEIFGFPVSRTFTLLGCTVQVFQRLVAQVCPGQGAAFMNILEPDIFPFTQVNFSTFPGVDDGLKNSTPKVTDPDYATAILDFVRANAPDTFEGVPVNFGQTFFSLITPEQAGTDDPGLLGLINLEAWGAPTSRPARDPNNPDFIYQRFQRGIMHHIATQGFTRAILMADYLKQVMRNSAELPPDLRAQAQAQNSRFFAQYCPGQPNWLCRPAELPGTDLTFAFEQG